MTPTLKEVKVVGLGGTVLARMQAQVLVLHFEGSWMPIQGTDHPRPFEPLIYYS